MFNFSEVCVERPLGTKGNNDVLNLLYNAFTALKFQTIELPFECTVWQPEDSFLEQNGNRIKLFPSPFSRELSGNFSIKYVSTLTELQNIEGFMGILIFTNELSKNGIMPKDFPFYFPENDKLLYELLENIEPKGIITITGQDPASGLNPFPIFEDPNLKTPTAYVSKLESIVETANVSIEIVPFNGEDSPEVSGQMAYLEYLKKN
jgi:aminopeptidase YwaD